MIATPKERELTVFRGTLAKLIVFSVSLAVAPLATYFGSEKYLWNGACTTLLQRVMLFIRLTMIAGNSTYAAISAVVAANVVLVSYIITSVMDDTSANETRSPLADAPGETRKDR